MHVAFAIFFFACGAAAALLFVMLLILHDMRKALRRLRTDLDS